MNPGFPRRQILITGFALLVTLGLVASSFSAEEQPEDHRAWQHGVDVIRIGENLLVVWGSPGNPPKPNLGGDWQHDVYYAWLNASATGEDTWTINPKVLVSKPEAQEPPSIAINTKGTLLMSTEDGSDGINQLAGLWDSALHVLRKYPFMIKRGGHSGHVAAMGERFLVAYGEGWVDHGGFLDQGTGKDIYARIVGNNGIPDKEMKLASGHRDGWPLVAGSDNNWLVVWQRYPAMTLHSALISPTGQIEVQHKIIDDVPIRYAYDVEFAPQLDSYVVAGSSGESGFISLISLTGEIVKTQQGLPAMVSESRIILGWDGSHCIGVYPVSPHGVAVVRLNTNSIELVKIIDHPYPWDYSGTTGIFVAPDRVLFVTLSTTGLHLIPINLQH